MYKQSAYVIALLLGATSSYRLNSNFATGMNGDEDLKQDIIMKGDKFHYAATPFVETLSPPERNREAQLNATAAGRYHHAQVSSEENVQLRFVNNADPAEGVLFPQTGHAIHHSTYYAKKTPEETFVQDEGEGDSGSGKGTPTEGVHTLAPIPQMTTANGPSEFAYPNQRTTFYAQGPLAEPEKVHTLDPKIARTHTTFYDKQNGLWRGQELSDKKMKIDPISPTNYDPWVYETSKEGMPSQRQWHAQTGAQSLAEDSISAKGYNQQVHDFTEENIRAYNEPSSFAQKQDVANQQINHDVWAFTSDNTNPLPLSRQEVAPASLAQDIGPRGINEDVHFFTNPLVDSEGRAAKPPPENTDAQQSVQNLVQKQINQKDIGETNCDEEVHGFVKHCVPPLNEAVKSEKPFVPNGSDPKSHAQISRKDVAEPKMDEEVHGFVKDNVPPLNEWQRTAKPYAPNGSDPKSHVQVGKNCRVNDIGETKCDEEVHGFVADNVPPLNEWERSKKPYAPNGSDPKSHAQKSQEDIANKEIRPDVWKTVHEMINPAPLSRPSKAPEEENDLNIENTIYDKENGLYRTKDE